MPPRNRLTYFPRTPPFMEAKSYSGRISSSRILFIFFIEPSFASGRLPGADNSCSVAPLAMGYNQKPAERRHPNCRESLFEGRMVRIRGSS